MELNFCRRCGAELYLLENHIYRCKNNHTIYNNCAPSTGVFILKPNNKLLLSVRGIEPRKGMLDAFGGFVDGEETVESALERELKEELNIGPKDYSEPVFLRTAIGHYPYGGEVLSVLSSFFYIHLKSDVKLAPQDDVADIKEVDLHDVDYQTLHDKDIVAGVKKLQSILL